VRKTAEHVREIGLDINELDSEAYIEFLDRAEKRVRKALDDVITYTSTQPQDNPREIELETFSFPISVMLVAATEDSLVKSRFSLAEAKRVSELLKNEKKEKLLAVANNFAWNMRLALDNSLPHYVFVVRFPVFLRNATGFHDKKWKLVNHLLINGEVYLTKMEVSRLLEEEVRKYIEEKVDTKIRSLPPGIMARVTQLRQLATKEREHIQLVKIPKRVVIEAFPSCIKKIYDRVVSGRPASHIGRFALTAFLLSIGMAVEDVFNFFRSVSDFNERMTRYQVEHIAGTRGSGTKYSPPNCATLRTHGICISPEPECERMVNPLVCYKKKLENIPEEKPADEN
jgi:DNA primase large subunit